MRLEITPWLQVLCVVTLLPLLLCLDAPEKHKAVIIIGAGAAGLTAATELASSGVDDFIVLEAEDRLGGRIFNIPYEWDTSIDLGAQWLYGQKGNIVYEMAKPLGLVQEECDTSNNFISANSSGAPISREADLALFDVMEGIIEDNVGLAKQSRPLGDYVRERLRLEIPEIIELHHLQHGPTFEQVTEYVDKHQSVNHASDSWFETSTTSQTELNEDEGCPYNLWKKGGFGNFFKVLMRQVSGQSPVDLSNKILYKKEVNKIDWEYQNGAAVSCSDGSVYTAYKIIITVPLGVLKSKLITFVPSLPAQKLNAIEGLNFGTVDKIFIRFPAKWWKDGCQGFNLYWTQQDKTDLFKDMVHVDGKPWVWGILGFYMDAEDPLTLLGWIAGPTARYMETLPMAVLQADIMRLFRHFLGGAYIIPEPIRIVRSAWSINPHFRGSYSSRSVTTDRLNTSAADLAAPVINREGRPVLLFAGEATSPHHYGTVNGAVESGARETANAIVYLRREGFFEKLVNIAVKELEHKGNQVGRILNLFGGGI
ncbi:hypothetical protein M8J76_009549 [Diaphorina citri]|nr:hypothetical protein M8J76_009549 [Diaphorina citri]